MTNFHVNMQWKIACLLRQNMMASTILGLPHRDLVVRYDSSLTNEQLYKLFDIVPGLEEIKLGLITPPPP